MVLLVLQLWYPMKHCTVDLLLALAMLPKTTCICSPSCVCGTTVHCTVCFCYLLMRFFLQQAMLGLGKTSEFRIVYFYSMSYVENIKSTQLKYLYVLHIMASLSLVFFYLGGQILHLVSCWGCWATFVIILFDKSTSLMFFGS